MRSKALVYIIGSFSLTSLMTACSKKNTDCDNSVKPVVSTNSPVSGGDTLKLSVSGVGDVFMYNWYGPNGFSSHDSTPVIPGSTTASSGRYTVDVITKAGCIYTAVTDSVVIGATQIPCSLADEQADISGDQHFYFTTITGSPNGGSYFVEAHGAEGDAELEFFGSGQPAGGIYSAQPQGGDWGLGNVHISVTDYDGLWYGDPGTVYVSVNNHKITVSACTLSFTSDTYGFKTTGNLQLTEQ